jgi:hypothetical protein
MKNAILGLMAATLLATPALASDGLAGLTDSELKQIAATQVVGSWRTVLFNRLDVDESNELSVKELETSGCTVHIKFFKYADDNRSGGLSRPEFFNNRDLFGRCK